MPSRGSGTGSYLVGVKGAEPALNVGGIPAGDQAAVLEGAQFQGCIGRSSCDHLVEGVLQGYWVIMGSLVLQTRGERGSACHVEGPKEEAFVGQKPGGSQKTLSWNQEPWVQVLVLPVITL